MKTGKVAFFRSYPAFLHCFPFGLAALLLALGTVHVTWAQNGPPKAFPSIGPAKPGLESGMYPASRISSPDRVVTIARSYLHESRKAFDEGRMQAAREAFLKAKAIDPRLSTPGWLQGDARRPPVSGVPHDRQTVLEAFLASPGPHLRQALESVLAGNPSDREILACSGITF